MDDPLLSSLCRICNIHEAKYTCPRCYFQTCSLPCSRRHKLWSSCSGIRDPTKYMPMSQLATPSGIDHDYNFLHSIETRVERSEKVIVVDKELVGKEELQFARTGVRNSQRHGEERGEAQIRRTLERMRTTVKRAPKGMRRNLENETSWSRNSKCINWQVEWIREGEAGRILGRAIGNRPIAEVYSAIMDEERKRNMTEDEVRLERKRKAAKTKEKQAKRLRISNEEACTSQKPPLMQDAKTGAWCCDPENCPAPRSSRRLSTGEEENIPSILPYRLYLLRPHTPSSFPKVLVPLQDSASLEKALQGRTILEFPTIYALEREPHSLPDQYMLEEDFLSAMGHKIVKEDDVTMKDAKESSEENNDSDQDQDQETDGEEGEILPLVWGGQSKQSIAPV